MNQKKHTDIGRGFGSIKSTQICSDGRSQVAQNKSDLHIFVLFKKWTSPTSFCLFLFFSNTISLKNCRLQEDSNVDPRRRRRSADHLTTTTTRHRFGPTPSIHLENTDCTADLLFDSFGFDQTSKYVSNST